MTPLKHTTYVLFDESGEIIRQGWCAENLVTLQASKPGHRAIVAKHGCDIKDKMIIPSNGAKPYMRRRSQAEIDARTPKYPEPIDSRDVMVQALKAKGIELTPADMAAAVTALRDQRGDKKG